MRIVVAALLAVGTCLGCQPKQAAVWVDVDAILAADPAKEIKPFVEVRPPQGLPAQRYVIESKPKRSLGDPANTGSLQIAESIEQAQRDAARLLVKRLTSFYDRESERYARSERANAGDVFRRAFDSIYPDIRERFEKYAEARAPLMIRLALVAGWPDPDPKSEIKPAEGDGEVRKRSLNEAHNLRSALADVESRYQTDLKAIMDRAESSANQELSAMLLRIANFADQMRQKAIRDAESQIADHPQELGLVLASEQPITLPETPRREITLPAQPPFPSAPKVQSEGILSSSADRRMLIQHQLQIWLGLHRYQLAEGPSKGREATQEFVLWRRNLQAGP